MHGFYDVMKAAATGNLTGDSFHKDSSIEKQEDVVLKMLQKPR